MTSTPGRPPVPIVVDRADPAYAGQAAYTESFLAHVYDPLVVRFTNRFAWRCPRPVLLRMYDEHVRAVHLDIGPGTGYYLDHCRFGSGAPAITLLDPNPHVLAASAARLARYAPTVHQASALEPIGLEHGRFESVALAHVLHCLPGTMRSKARVFEHVEPLLKPGGIVFGSTVLAEGVRHTAFSRRVMRSLNRKGIFSNGEDDRVTLRRALEASFTDVRIQIRGTVALFEARRAS